MSKRAAPIQISITELKNLTINKSLIKKSSKKESQIDFVEFGEQVLVLEVPSKICTVGNHIQLTLKTKNTKKDLEFNCTVKVTNVEDVDDQRAKADLKLLQFDVTKWKAIMQAFRDRQDSVTKLFQSMKG